MLGLLYTAGQAVISGHSYVGAGLKMAAFQMLASVPMVPATGSFFRVSCATVGAEFEDHG